MQQPYTNRYVQNMGACRSGRHTLQQKVRKLYPLMNVVENNKEGWLKAIERKYNTNTCYSEFLTFLAKNGIESKGFSWA